TEKVAFFIGDMTDALTTAEAPLLAGTRRLHCATSNPMVFRGSFNLGSNIVATVASPGQYGMAARSLVAAWPPEGRVVLAYERDKGGECVDDWERHMRQIRAYNASVIKRSTKTPEVDLEEAGFPPTLARHMFGTLVVNETNLRLVAESEDDPYFQHVKDTLNSLNIPFWTDGQQPALTLETAQSAACLAMLLPSLTNLGNAGYDVTWEEIAEGRLFERVDRNTIMNLVNHFRTPGRGDVLRTLTKTGHEARPMTMSNAINRDALDRGSFLQSLNPVGQIVNGDGNMWVAKDSSWQDFTGKITFPDGTSNPPIPVWTREKMSPNSDELEENAEVPARVTVKIGWLSS
ncbi:hypothetical protein HK102_004387, partial [Quaeritorhiza haematococci]